MTYVLTLCSDQQHNGLKNIQRRINISIHLCSHKIFHEKFTFRMKQREIFQEKKGLVQCAPSELNSTHCNSKLRTHTVKKAVIPTVFSCRESSPSRISRVTEIEETGYRPLAKLNCCRNSMAACAPRLKRKILLDLICFYGDSSYNCQIRH